MLQNPDRGLDFLQPLILSRSGRYYRSSCSTRHAAWKNLVRLDIESENWPAIEQIEKVEQNVP